MNVLHISPTFFSDDSVIGGGERYPHELARFMARATPTALISFAALPSEKASGDLKLIYAPDKLHPLVLKWMLWADILHCHQVISPITDLAILIGRITGRKVFATDLGGNGKSLASIIPILKSLNGLLLISEYSKQVWEKRSNGIPNHRQVIGGGVDLEKFSPGEKSRHPRVLYAGRILPHKGIDTLVDAMDPDVPLDIVGRIYHRPYYDVLTEKSVGKKINFFHDLNDEELIQKYRQAWVAVQPSCHESYYQETTEIPELLGLVSLEAQACGTPVIVTDAGSLPETVINRETGFITPQRNSDLMRLRLREILSNPKKMIAMGQCARRFIENKYNWPETVRRCLKAYFQ